ncbi:unnamed protein product [Lupinus luteus]|uniref:Uncharacterized protein n=1 Tax=Lupinus luteus TaxID=3873 RepID=A0AAV1XNR5_LUPLU
MNGYVTAVMVVGMHEKHLQFSLWFWLVYGISYADNDEDDDEEDESEIEDEVEGEEGKFSTELSTLNESLDGIQKICLEGLSLHEAKRGVSHSFKAISDNNNGGSFIARRRLDITARIIGASKTIRLSCCY